MRVIILTLILISAAPVFARTLEDACPATPDCVQARLRAAMERRLGAAPEPARKAELMTAQVLWEAYREMQCGNDDPCRLRQAQWRLKELETTAR
jgi:hypothetical protein